MLRRYNKKFSTAVTFAFFSISSTPFVYLCVFNSSAGCVENPFVPPFDPNSYDNLQMSSNDIKDVTNDTKGGGGLNAV